MSKRERMLEKAREYTTGTYIRKFVANVFQLMIRAEAGCLPAGQVNAMKGGYLVKVSRRVGECVCVTCGAVHPWKGNQGKMHTGHFIGSRRNSILFEETNVAPQCALCNRHKNGMPQAFRAWMEFVRGKEEVERLERLRNTTRQFSREELVEMRLGYMERLKIAEGKMQ